VPTVRKCAHPKGCSKPIKSYGWCSTHYSRILRTGSPGSSDTTRIYRRTDRRCSIQECGSKHFSKGFCQKHYFRLRRNGDPDVVTRDVGGPGIGYRAAHYRIQKDRGLAAAHKCQFCNGAAAQWAYDHQDPDARIDQTTTSKCIYSTNPAHYFPLCARCHKQFDLSRRQKV